MKLLKYIVITSFSIAVGAVLIFGVPAIQEKITFLQNKGEQLIYDGKEFVSNNEGEVAHLPEPLRVIKEELSKTEKESPLTVSGIVIATNEARMQNGLPPLVGNTVLNTSAQVKAQDMLDLQYFEHDSPSGAGVQDLADNTGYEYIIIGENLALGNFYDNTDVVTVWMNSPGHRANILNTRYTEIGIGIVKGIYEGKNVWLAVQHFGLPKDFCPKIDATLKDQITKDTNTSKTLEVKLQKEKEIIESKRYSGKEHNEHVDTYNALVEQYNALQDRIKANIATYNTQVTTFNTCAEL